MTLEPLAGPGRTLAEQAYDAIIAGVLRRDIRPGDPLIMDQLASELNISRTPVRDALQRLEGEGLIEARGRRGYVVRSIGIEETGQLYQAREAIEGYAARVIAEVGDPEAIARIYAVVTEAEGLLDGTIAGSYWANRVLHRAIVAETGNAYLLSGFDLVWGASLAALSYQSMYETQVSDRELLADHEHLIQALASDDGDKAQAAMIEHVRDGLDVNLDAIERAD